MELLSQQGNYLIITHPGFMPADGEIDHPLSMYLDDRSAAIGPDGLGFSPVLVNWDAIVEQYGYGMSTPEALTRYLKAATNTFDVGHLLIVGGDVYDPLNYLETGAKSFVPTSYTTTQSSFFTPSDAITLDLDGDEISDIPHGRWPVRVLSDLEGIVSKTLAYSAPGGLASDKSALLITEEYNPSEAFDYVGQMERINQHLVSENPLPGEPPVQWDAAVGKVEKVYVDDIVAEVPPPSNIMDEARDRIISGGSTTGTGINGGKTLTIFTGHGSTSDWGYGLFTPIHAQSLGNAGSPTLMMPMACYTTHYNEIDTNTLAHQLMFAQDGDGDPIGAVAIHAAVFLSDLRDNEALGTRALDNQISKGQTLGQAVDNARKGVPGKEVKKHWTVLGDPTIMISP